MQGLFIASGFSGDHGHAVTGNGEASRILLSRFQFLELNHGGFTCLHVIFGFSICNFDTNFSGSQIAF